ncbi:ZIP zinc/iron transport family [Leucogyrophana mollusca]|uniref:ZIP zinc/iron transport family n=1 Tax=Leucogyrophana mollusca TaxID=85980 RepID=A0ACB8BAT6_9AGAM|nr:ZIP zinc/iron transport family [Leucogyrophana mollusca]
MSSPSSIPTASPSVDNTLNCSSGGGANTYTNLRIASVFIILASSSFGALFPVIARRTSWLHVPKGVFEFAKYFGSGVIIATAFIHLLSPALDELSSPCLSPAWQEYPYALALAMLSLFSIFIVELIAFRWGTSKLAALGIKHDAHGHGLGAHAAHGPEGSNDPGTRDTDSEKTQDIEAAHNHEHHDDSAAAQIIGVFILEFGVILHSVLIGLTLAVDPDFKVLFVVIVFHQMFEGLGLGSRLAYMNLPPRFRYVPICAAAIYGITTPIGIAAGLGVRSSYNPGSTTNSIISGVLDSLSAGILLYTGVVELLAHEFLFNKEMINGSNGKLAYALVCMLSGTAIMALLGRWA